MAMDLDPGCCEAWATARLTERACRRNGLETFQFLGRSRGLRREDSVARGPALSNTRGGANCKVYMCLGGPGKKMTERIYLDWNATAPLRPAARAAMLAALDQLGDPSSLHTEGRAGPPLCETA